MKEEPVIFPIDFELDNLPKDRIDRPYLEIPYVAITKQPGFHTYYIALFSLKKKGEIVETPSGKRWRIIIGIIDTIHEGEYNRNPVDKYKITFKSIEPYTEEVKSDGRKEDEKPSGLPGKFKWTPV